MGRGFSLVLAALIPLSAQAGSCGSVLATPVEVYRTQLSSAGFDFLKRESDLQFARPNTSPGAVFSVEIANRQQKMNGFGGAMTESCAINLMRLPEKMRTELMESLFDKRKGAGFDYIRVPVGGSDFADGNLGSYTYDDSPGDIPDPLFQHFDMSRDEKSFALIREAKRINPNLKVMISPWSPPAWMKIPTKLNGGRLNPAHFADLARYFVKVIQGMRARGVPVDSLTVQNEPNYPNDFYPSMAMTPQEQIRFIRDFLAPELMLAGLRVGIFIYDHNWDRVDQVNEILDDPVVKRMVKGIAYHCYAGEYGDMLASTVRHPEVPSFQTECSGALGSKLYDDFEWWLTGFAMGPISLGSTGSMGWNLCLDEKGGPTNNGCLACEGLVTTDFTDPAAPQLFYSPEYYALAQLSRFMDPGTVSLGIQTTNAGLLKSSAFANADGSVSLVVWNSYPVPVNIRVHRSECSAFDYIVAPRTAVTFKWQESVPGIPTL